MAWEVEFTDEFPRLVERPLRGTTGRCGALCSATYRIRSRPRVSRTQKLAVSVIRRCASCGLESAGRPLRTLYAFTPLRSAILLIGGEKTGDDRSNERMAERSGLN